MGTTSFIILSRGLLVGGSQQRLPPSKPPRPPLFLEPGKTQGDITRPCFQYRRRGVVTPIGSDKRPRPAMMGGDQMQRQFL
jgi:hypothetical protein